MFFGFGFRILDLGFRVLTAMTSLEHSGWTFGL